MKKSVRLIPVLLALAALFLCTNCGSSEPRNTLEKIKKEGKIVIATHPVNPPFEFGAGTGVDGFDYELGQAIAKELGVESQWVKRPFEKSFEALESGEADIVFNAVTITPERQKTYLFSTPYFQTGQTIAIRKDREDIKSIDDLKGKKIGVQKNTTAEAFLKAKGFTAAEITPYESTDDALFELNRKLLDAVVGDAPTLEFDIRMLTNLTVIGPLLTKEDYGVVLRQKDAELKSSIDAIIKKLEQSGELAKLVKKWKLDGSSKE